MDPEEIHNQDRKILASENWPLVLFSNICIKKPSKIEKLFLGKSVLGEKEREHYRFV